MSDRDAIVCQRCGYPPHRHSGGTPNTCPIVATYLPPSGDHLPASVAGDDAITEADREAVKAFAQEPYVVGYLTNTKLEGDWRGALASAFARHRATHAAEVERLREALVRAASRFEIAADNAKERAPVFRKWAQEARQALEASR